jgi:undecaprenyl diphosphate synthase
MEGIDKTNLPKHIAIIMDGNGRWAKTKGKLRVFGHQKGVTAVRDTVEGAAEIGIKYLTLYAFSTENWSRPAKEVNALMTLLVSSIHKETKTLMKNNIRLSAIGNIAKLPIKAQEKLKEAIEKTKDNSRMTLILALSYSSRWEILNAVKNIIKDERKAEQINEDVFQQYLSTKSVPDPELLIRTSGEYRISNFLLWQIAYSELYFTNTLWPDFSKTELEKAILDYQSRERRFGKTTEQKQQ